MIQVGTQMTYEVNTRSGVKVLARGEDIRCLGKRDQCKTGENGIGSGRLEGRYDSVKAPESTREDQNARENDKRRGSARVGDQCLLDLGQWSHFLPSVEEEPPGV